MQWTTRSLVTRSTRANGLVIRPFLVVSKSPFLNLIRFSSETILLTAEQERKHGLQFSSTER